MLRSRSEGCSAHWVCDFARRFGSASTWAGTFPPRQPRPGQRRLSSDFDGREGLEETARHLLVAGTVNPIRYARRLILDDVRSDSPQREMSWHFDCFFTHKCLESRQLEDMTLPDSEYQSLGEAVLMRLMALTGTTK